MDLLFISVVLFLLYFVSLMWDIQQFGRFRLCLIVALGAAVIVAAGFAFRADLIMALVVAFAADVAALIVLAIRRWRQKRRFESFQQRNETLKQHHRSHPAYTVDGEPVGIDHLYDGVPAQER